MRGGGGDFGVVTALEFGLFELDQVIAGALFFPIERTAEVLGAWAEWSRSVPDTVTSIGRVLRFPPMPELPPFLSGRSFVLVEAVIQESPERADALLAPLRDLQPEMDTVHPQAPAEVLQLHMDPPGPTPGNGDGMMLTDLPDDSGTAGGRAANARMRREGTRNLLAAARAAGARRVLAQSVAWELEGDGAAAKAELERMTLDAGGVVLRYGRFYGPGTYYPDARPPPPRIHVDEAARRTVALLDSPSGIVEVIEPT